MTELKLKRFKQCFAPFVIINMLLTLLFIIFPTYYFDFQGLEITDFLFERAAVTAVSENFCFLLFGAAFAAINVLYFFSAFAIIRPIFSRTLYVVSSFLIIDVGYIMFEIYQYYAKPERFLDYTGVNYLIFPNYISRLIAQFIFELLLAAAVITYCVLAKRKDRVENVQKD